MNETIAQPKNNQYYSKKTNVTFPATLSVVLRNRQLVVVVVGIILCLFMVQLTEFWLEFYIVFCGIIGYWWMNDDDVWRGFFQLDNKFTFFGVCNKLEVIFFLVWAEFCWF